jgi:hypothetical protein
MTVARQEFDDMLARLNRLSVERHSDAYADIDWDGLPLEVTDPRFELPALDPLSATEWYRAQPPETRARIGLYRYAAYMKVGEHFENLLQRGLLLRAVRLPNGTPEFRYLHHELIEESQHTLMFQEFVNRTGMPVRGMPKPLLRLIEALVPFSPLFPTLFFVAVLGGEDPVDHLQRLLLRTEADLHPLLERIVRIHVSEEARHVSFARQVLQNDTPRMGRIRRRALALLAPVTLAVLTRAMLRPPGDLVRYFRIPKEVARDAVRTRRLLTGLGLATPTPRAVWRAVGLWDPSDTAVAAR